MPIEVLMPALSPTMEEGKLAKWLKAEGDAVSAGDVLAEIETDKATMEVEAVDEGVLGKILIAAGTEGVKVNTPIALLLADGEDKSALDKMPAPVPAPAAEKPEAHSRGRQPTGPVQAAGRAEAGTGRSRNIPARPTPRRCARRCATPWRKRCAATRWCCCWAKKSPSIRAPTR